MAQVNVLDLNNNVVGTVELADDVFAAPVNEHLIYEAVRHYQAGLRAGTAKTKSRWEVAGSGKKLWRQKGTGRARMGSIRSPLWRKGGTVHGPKPRDYSYRLNKKMIEGALRSALSAKLRDGSVIVVRNFQLADHKTKNFRQALDKLNITRKALVVDLLSDESRNLILASRNLEGIRLVPTRDVTTYDVLFHQHLILSEAAAKRLSESLSRASEKEAA